MSELQSFGQQLGECVGGLIGFGDPESERRNVEVLRLFYRSFNENEVEAMVALLTDDFELNDTAAGVFTHGRAAYRQRVRTGRTAFPDATAEITGLVSQNDVVISEVRNLATHTGPFRLPGSDEVFPPTGRRLDVVGCEVYEFLDGKIARSRIYYDLTTLARQLGIAATNGRVANEPADEQ
ncbi:ester cyclase [Streptomyces sp. NPDC042319]|uniref:ester cyclase n=1 Tax=Streptomyces sp. NPDC042319 TaxID=3154332 RepID=UPI00340F9E54